VTDGCLYNISSSQSEKEENPWFPQEEKNKRRPEGSEKKKSKGPQKIDRLRRSTDINKVFRKGNKFVNKFFILYALPNTLDTIRYTIIAGKGIGNSVKRNRVKRVLREALRLSIKKLQNGNNKLSHFDIIVIARKAALEVKTQDILYEIEKVLSNLKKNPD